MLDRDLARADPSGPASCGWKRIVENSGSQQNTLGLLETVPTVMTDYKPSKPFSLR
jgi:hypothetical protein